MTKYLVVFWLPLVLTASCFGDIDDSVGDVNFIGCDVEVSKSPLSVLSSFLLRPRVQFSQVRRCSAWPGMTMVDPTRVIAVDLKRLHVLLKLSRTFCI